MKKMISLFQRNYEGDKLVRDEVVTGAEWVIRGEGIATRKWDGTACLMHPSGFMKRYDAKRGKTPPSGFIPCQKLPDPVTGHWPGWVPVDPSSPADEWHRLGYYNCEPLKMGWTYELCGPKIGGNTENLPVHFLIRHGAHPLYGTNPLYDVNPLFDTSRMFEKIKQYLTDNIMEGIVWWKHIGDVDCDKVKIKAKDFGIKRL